MIKKLPIKEPDVTVYPHHAHLLAIYNGIYNDDDYKFVWYCTNYVQLEYCANNLDFSNAFDILPLLENCPWLIKDSISYNMINDNWKSIIYFIIASINQGYYIYIELNEFFISAYDNYNKKYISHTLLIYGYDDIKEIFHIADFFHEGRYSFQKASFDEIYKAYTNKPSDFLCGVYLYRQQERNYLQYTYNRSVLIDNLEDYINSVNSQKRNVMLNFKRVNLQQDIKYFGIDIYDKVCYEIINSDKIDLRKLYLLKAHKKIFLLIILSLAKRNLINSEYNLYKLFQTLYNDSSIILNLGIKYNVTRKLTLKEVIVERINNIKNDEIRIIPLLIKELNEKSQYNHHNNAIFDKEEFGLKIRDCSYEDDIYTLRGNNAYAQATFLGSNVKIIANLSSFHDNCSVYLDGELYTITSLSLYEEYNNHEVCKISNLANIFHTVRVVNNGMNCIKIKRFEIEKMIPNNVLVNSYCKLLAFDKVTKGNWMSKYGHGGYVIPGYDIEYPSYGDISIQTSKIYINSDILPSNYLLQSPKDDKRISACFYDENSFDISIIISGHKSKRISLYCLNWTTEKEIICTITSYNLTNDTVLHKDKFAVPEDGIYIIYEVLGAIKFSIQFYSKYQDRYYGDFYGMFFE